MEKKDIGILAKEDVFKLIGKEWMLVSAGNIDNFNTMTASWGCLGWLWNRPVAVVFIRPERYTYGFVEDNAKVTLSFFGQECRKALQLCGTKNGRDTDKVAATGLQPVTLPSGAVTFAQARLSLDCRKLFKASMQEADFLDASLLDRWYGEHGGLHDIYVVEIEDVYEG